MGFENDCVNLYKTTCFYGKNVEYLSIATDNFQSSDTENFSKCTFHEIIIRMRIQSHCDLRVRVSHNLL